MNERWESRLETGGLLGLVLGLLLLAPLGITPPDRGLRVFVETARLLGVVLVVTGVSVFLAVRKPWQQ